MDVKNVYVKIFSDALNYRCKPGNKVHTAQNIKIINDRIIVQSNIGDTNVDMWPTLRIFRYFTGRVYLVNGEYVILKLIDASHEGGHHIVFSIKKINKYKSYFDNVNEDIFTHIIDKLDFESVNNLSVVISNVVSDKMWERMMMTKYIDYHKELKDIKYEIEWKDIYYSCLTLESNLYTDKWLNYKTEIRSYEFDLAHSLLAAIMVKSYDANLYNHIKNCRIHDLNWYDAYRFFNYQRSDNNVRVYFFTFQAYGVLSSFRENTYFPDINYIMLNMISGRHPDIISYGAELCNNLYLYKRRLLDKVSIEMLRTVCSKCNLKEYPLLKTYLMERLES